MWISKLRYLLPNMAYFVMFKNCDKFLNCDKLFVFISIIQWIKLIRSVYSSIIIEINGHVAQLASSASLTWKRSGVQVPPCPPLFIPVFFTNSS